MKLKKLFGESSMVFIIFILIVSLSSCKDSLKTKGIKITPISSYFHLKMGMDVYGIKYMSDGLEIQGYIHKPKKPGKFPVIIYNRGGNRDLGTHDPKKNMAFQEEMTNAGFVVLSTQLRGNRFSEGQDEYGGGDLNDIMRLIQIAGDLEYADEENIGVYGISRGGMNAYQISRMTDEIICIAVVGAPVDPKIGIKNRPEIYEKVYLPLVGDSLLMKEEYDKRSPIKWVNEINEPVLILHGMDDEKVLPINAKRMIEEMEKNGNKLEYKLFQGGDHSLYSHTGERNEMVIDWFNRHLK